MAGKIKWLGGASLATLLVCSTLSSAYAGGYMMDEGQAYESQDATSSVVKKQGEWQPLSSHDATSPYVQQEFVRQQALDRQFSGRPNISYEMTEREHLDRMAASDAVQDLRAMSLGELESYINELDYESYSSALTLEEHVNNLPLSKRVEQPRVPLIQPEEPLYYQTPIYAPKVEPNAATAYLAQDQERLDTSSLNNYLIEQSQKRLQGRNELNPQAQAFVDRMPARALEEKEKGLRVREEVTIVRENGAEVFTDQVTEEGEAMRSTAVAFDLQVNDDRQAFFEKLQAAYQALKSNQYETAVTFYKQALYEKPNHIPALFGLATAYHRSGQFEQAQDIYLYILEQDRYHQGATQNFLALISQDNPGAALVQLKKIEAINPEYAPIPAQIAQIYMREGDYEMASRYMSRAATLDPGNVRYRHYLALLMQELEQYEVAMKIYRQLIEMHRVKGVVLPESVEIISRRITHLQQMIGLKQS